MIVRKFLYRILASAYDGWSRFLPSGHRLFSLPTGGRVYLDLSESRMMLARVFGLFERGKHLAIDHFLQLGDGFIDAGSNKGEFAIHAAIRVGTQGHVVAFEPEPKNCAWIRKSVQASQCKNVFLEESALGSEVGKARLTLGRKSGWHSLVSRHDTRNCQSIEVRVTSIDRFLEANPISRLRLIKIDVEGFELEVLKGARNTLSTIDDIALLIDLHPHLGVDSGNLASLLRDSGFRLFEEEDGIGKAISSDATQFPDSIIAVKGTFPNFRLPHCEVGGLP